MSNVCKAVRWPIASGKDVNLGQCQIERERREVKPLNPSSAKLINLGQPSIQRSLREVRFRRPSGRISRSSMLWIFREVNLERGGSEGEDEEVDAAFVVIIIVCTNGLLLKYFHSNSPSTDGNSGIELSLGQSLIFNLERQGNVGNFVIEVDAILHPFRLGQWWSLSVFRDEKNVASGQSNPLSSMYSRSLNSSIDRYWREDNPSNGGRCLTLTKLTNERLTRFVRQESHLGAVHLGNRKPASLLELDGAGGLPLTLH